MSEVRKTVFEIEREARWRIWALFGLLVAMAFVTVFVATLLVEVFAALFGTGPQLLRFTLSPRGLVVTLLAAALVAVVYWVLARIGVRGRLLAAMHARELDPGDRYHQRLANVVEEMRLATGAPRVEAVVVPTLGMNAFAFSDLRDSGCIGVTEGALARLSRQQLEAVVAHEFAHVLSGDYITATTACLLFGVYSSAGEKLEDAAMGGGAQVQQPYVMVGALALRLLLGALEIASAFTNAAISRQREWAADLAAVRYMRDPLSLAQALRMMARHPGGAGYIPPGLSPLCIRPTEFWRAGTIKNLLATHPPVDARIMRLLRVANVGWEDFQRQAEAADETSEHRQHIEAAPGATHLGQRDAGAALAGLAAPLAAATAPFSAQAGAAGGGAEPASAALAAGAAGGGTFAEGGASPEPGASPVGGPLAIPSRGGGGDGVVPGSALICPSCGDALQAVDYEGVDVLACPSCRGRLAGTSQVERILARRQVAFSEDQQKIAEYVRREGDRLRRAARAARGAPQTALIPCPKCAKTMMRRMYSYEHAVETDCCFICDLFWFESDELEVLQILAEGELS